MTDPTTVRMDRIERRLNDAVHALQNLVPAMARRAVDVPVKRLGVVETAEPALSVIIDGDTLPTAITNGTGQRLPVGGRVAIDFYPPHGIIVTGLLWPVLEQAWASALIAVPTSVSASTTLSGWTQRYDSVRGFSVDGDALVCDWPGWWSTSMAGGFAFNGNGTHRAVGIRSTGVAVNLNMSQQFAAPGGTPTVGFGLSMGAEAVEPYAVGDRLTVVARQDSGVSLNATLRLHLRWVSPLQP